MAEDEIKELKETLKHLLDQAVEARDSIELAALMDPNMLTGARNDTSYADMIRSMGDAHEIIEHMVAQIRNILGLGVEQ